jgi:hypothetical protein
MNPFILLIPSLFIWAFPILDLFIMSRAGEIRDARERDCLGGQSCRLQPVSRNLGSLPASCFRRSLYSISYI